MILTGRLQVFIAQTNKNIQRKMARTIFNTDKTYCLLSSLHELYVEGRAKDGRRALQVEST